MNAWVQWLMPGDKLPGQRRSGHDQQDGRVAESQRAATLARAPRPFACSGSPVRSRRSHLFAPNFSASNALSSTRRVSAAAQHIAPDPKRGRLLAKRLYDNARVLTETYRAVVRANSARQPITPAAEWLLDNFHIVDEQIREIKNDLPPGFYRRLPKLADGPLQGYPRVFGVAWALVAHTDSAFDTQKLTRFVEAYQRVQPLTIGELWALAITLRITLVENLRRLAEAIMAQQSAKPVGRCARGPDFGHRGSRRCRTGIDNLAQPRSGAMVDGIRRRTRPASARPSIPTLRRRCAG